LKGPDAQPTNIHQVVRESLALLMSCAMERQVHIHAPLIPPGAMVLGDPVLLQQAIVNLVVNAMDAMDDLPPSRRRVDVQVATADAGVEIAVRDAGSGLSPDVERKLFEPFITTKPDHIGMGLTIVRGIVEAHGGTINAINNPEGGATFRFTLPAAGVA
jgi:two-component system sensor kinase FixL